MLYFSYYSKDISLSFNAPFLIKRVALSPINFVGDRRNIPIQCITIFDQDLTLLDFECFTSEVILGLRNACSTGLFNDLPGHTIGERNLVRQNLYKSLTRSRAFKLQIYSCTYTGRYSSAGNFSSLTAAPSFSTSAIIAST